VRLTRADLRKACQGAQSGRQGIVEGVTMTTETAEEVLAEIRKVGQQIEGSEADRRRAEGVHDWATASKLQEKIADAMTRKELLTKQLKQIQRSGSYPD
jgi:hypothetical protein